MSLPLSSSRPVTLWLGICILLVAAMVVVGGLTRLTDSGLSMVNWQPVHGILPPMNAQEWQEEFAAYQHSPQYQQINHGMSLSEFQGIFWLEYWHRVLGRLIGLVFGLPLLFFTLTGAITRRQSLTYFSIFLLGGAQGLLGWYMVKSGLIDIPMVSPLRLAAHLTMACLLFSLLLWQWLKLYHSPLAGSNNSKTPHTPHLTTLTFLTLLFIQIILGALVAGVDAGLVYNSFPTMNGMWMPNGVWLDAPLLTNATAVQFIHRAGALVLLLALIALVAKLWRAPLPKLGQRALYALIAGMILQITFGALTVVHHVPTPLASLHQFTALLLLTCVITLLFSLVYARNGSDL